VRFVWRAVTGQLIEFHLPGSCALWPSAVQHAWLLRRTCPRQQKTLPGMISQQSIGLFASAGAPIPIIERIERANHGALVDPEYQRMLAELIKWRSDGFCNCSGMRRDMRCIQINAVHSNQDDDRVCH
jgi:hypothetical protein